MIFLSKVGGCLFHGVIVTEIASGSFRSFTPFFGNGCYPQDKQGKPLLVPLYKTANAPIHGFTLHKSVKNLNVDISFTCMRVYGSESRWCSQIQFVELESQLVLPRHMGPKEEHFRVLHDQLEQHF